MKHWYILTVLVLGLACNSKQRPLAVKPEKTIESAVPLKKKSDLQQSVTPPILGFNGANFSLHYDTRLEIVLDDFPMGFIRFPGGTIANGYYPNGNGYGYSKAAKTISKGVGKHLVKARKKAQTMTENVRVAVAKYCKLRRIPLLYVANVWDGTPKEVLDNLAYFKGQGIEIIGLELGNEYYLQAYRGEIKSAEDYIELCKPFVSEIVSNYPELPLSWVAAPSPSLKRVGNTDYFTAWNEHLLAEPLVRNISVHYYPNPEECELSDAQCLNKFLLKERMLWNAGFRELGEIFKGKGIWVTEWNMKKATIYGGGDFHKELLNTFMFDMLQLAAEKIPIQMLSYHNLVGGKGSIGNAVYSVTSDSLHTHAAKRLLEWYGNWAIEEVSLKSMGDNLDVKQINEEWYWMGKPFANICEDSAVLREASVHCNEKTELKYVKTPSNE